MPNREVPLELLNAAELAEALSFINRWLAGAAHTYLAASLGCFVGTSGYARTALNADLTPCALPLDGERSLRHNPI